MRAQPSAFTANDTTVLQPTPLALQRLPLADAVRLHVLPLEVQGSRLSVAVPQEPTPALLDELAWISECRIRPVAVDATAVREALRLCQIQSLTSTDSADTGVLPGSAHPIGTLSDPHPHPHSGPGPTEPGVDNTPGADSDTDPEDGAWAPSEDRHGQGHAVIFINTLLADAQAMGASDVHLECPGTQAPVHIRLRRDGRLEPYRPAPADLRRSVVARLKVMAQLDIAERRRPQDGRIRLPATAHRAAMEIRVATIPTQQGLEDVVLRLQNHAQALALEALHLHPITLKRLKSDLQRPHGLLLCAGPTGSGKTTTLHAMLRHLNTPDRKIWTAEDPVEISQEGLRQVQIDPRRDWTFERALRALLRADPDIIMVGEIRDRETLRTAIEAALTGHLVLSTLHTRSAADTVTRLLDMGLDPYQFADSLVGVMGQRLVRRCCTHCADPQTNPTASTPCRRCGGTGFWGRLAVHEWLSVDDALRSMIQARADTAALHRAAQQQGMVDMRQDGQWKVEQDLTRREEIEAALGVAGHS